MSAETSPKSPNPKVLDLEQPEKLSKVLKDDQYDCLSCRLTGATAFIGLGAYIYYSGKNQLAQQSKVLAKKTGTLGGIRARMVGTMLMSSSFVGMGLYRLVN